MSKITILVFLIFLAALGFFAMANKDVVTVKIPFGNTYEVLKIALILISTIVGALVILVISFIKDTKRVIDNLQYQKRQKKEARLQDFYSKALKAILGYKEEEAKEALRDILKEEPEHFDALLRLGDISLHHDDFATALEYYRKARDVHPADLQVLLSLAIVMEKLCKDDEALRCLEEILDKDSENLTALYKKRSILEKKEKWDDLVSLQKTIIKLEQNERARYREEQKLQGYRYEYGRSSLENGEPEKAEKAFRTVTKTDNTFIPAHLGLAEVMLMKGETEEAINFLEKGFQQMNSPILLERLEDLLVSVGEPGRLIRFYKNALSQNKHDNGLKFLLGKLYSRLEMVDDAIETLNSIDLGALTTPEMYGLKGDLYMKRNQVTRAADEFRKALSMKHVIRVPYCCSHCGKKAEDWAGRCPHCHEWSTYVLDIYGKCRA